MRFAVLTTFVALALAAALANDVYADAFDNQMSLQRNELRTEYRKVNKDLGTVEREIEDQEDPATISGSATGVWAVQNSMRDHARKLQQRRSELRERQGEIQREFRKLTRQIENRYDEVPIWWGGLD